MRLKEFFYPLLQGTWNGVVQFFYSSIIYIYILNRLFGPFIFTRVKFEEKTSKNQQRYIQHRLMPFDFGCCYSREHSFARYSYNTIDKFFSVIQILRQLQDQLCKPHWDRPTGSFTKDFFKDSLKI